MSWFIVRSGVLVFVLFLVLVLALSSFSILLFLAPLVSFSSSFSLLLSCSQAFGKDEGDEYDLSCQLMVQYAQRAARAYNEGVYVCLCVRMHVHVCMCVSVDA